MIQKFIKHSLLLVMLLSSPVLFADEPGFDVEDENGDISSSSMESETEEAPIDSSLVFLAMAGIAFGGYWYADKKAVRKV